MFVRIALTISCCVLGGSAFAVDNPIPFLHNPLTPSSTAPGSAQLQLSVAGTGFVSGSVVQWNGSPRATTFVSARKLTATIPASDLTTATSAFVTVVNPAPGGGRSNVAYFQVVTPRTGVAFKRGVNYPSGVQPYSLITSDLDGDGNLDIAAANVSGGNVSVLLGRGDGTFQSAVFYDSPFGIALAAGDFNGDGAQDLAVLGSDNVHGGNGRVDLMLGNGDGTFQAPVTVPAGDAPFSVAVADLNRDGKLDAVVSNNATGSKLISVFLGNGDGTLRPRVTYATGQNAQHVEIGDLNADGRLDLLVCIREAFAHAVSVLLGKGDGAFRPHMDTPFDGSPVSATLGDLNGDGALDASVVDADELAAVMLGNGNGTFGSQTNYPTVKYAFNNAVGIADLDGNDLQDLVVDTGTGVRVLVATTAGVFAADKKVDSGNSQGIAIGDFNRDGRPDVAVVTDAGVSVWVQATP